MVTFSERLQIANAFARYIKDASAEYDVKLDTDPLTFMGWLDSEGLLDTANCKKFIASEKFCECLKHFNGRKDCT